MCTSPPTLTAQVLEAVNVGSPARVEDLALRTGLGPQQVASIGARLARQGKIQRRRARGEGPDNRWRWVHLSQPDAKIIGEWETEGLSIRKLAGKYRRGRNQISALLQAVGLEPVRRQRCYRRARLTPELRALACRAHALWSEGTPLRDIAGQLGISTAWALYLRRAIEAERKKQLGR